MRNIPTKSHYFKLTLFPKRRLLLSDEKQEGKTKRPCQFCGWKTIPLPFADNKCSGCAKHYATVVYAIEEFEEERTELSIEDFFGDEEE